MQIERFGHTQAKKKKKTINIVQDFSNQLGGNEVTGYSGRNASKKS